MREILVLLIFFSVVTQYLGGAVSIGIAQNEQPNHPSDCESLKLADPSLKGGLYWISPFFLPTGGHVQVYCEMEKFGGGWTVIQKRVDGSVSFRRGWNAYKVGFGNLTGSYWLGNDNIHGLTSESLARYSLLVDMELGNGETGFAFYNDFSVNDENAKYKLNLTGYCGTYGDSLNKHNGWGFRATDSGQDGWWLHNRDGCCHSSLNGDYYGSSSSPLGSAELGQAVIWQSIPNNFNQPLKTVSMMIRRSSLSLDRPPCNPQNTQH